MQRIDSEKIWYQYFLETPLVTPTTSNPAELPELLKAPGVCVKSLERGRYGMPADFGKLVQYDAEADSVVVRSHATPYDPKCVWLGTVNEYENKFVVD